MTHINDFGSVIQRIISEDVDEKGRSIAYNIVDLVKGDIVPVATVSSIDSYTEKNADENNSK